jgi:hypothetical protein
MVEHTANGILAACAGTGVLTLEAHASLDGGTFVVCLALPLAASVWITIEPWLAGAGTGAVALSALCIDTARRWNARILRSSLGH